MTPSQLITETIKLEREACAKLCDEYAKQCERGGRSTDGAIAARELANLIRHREWE